MPPIGYVGIAFRDRKEVPTREGAPFLGWVEGSTMFKLRKKKLCKNHVWLKGKGYGNRRVCKKCGKIEAA